MKTLTLLPNYCKPLGWLLAIFGLSLGFAFVYFEVKLDFLTSFFETDYFLGGKSKQNLTDELALTALIVGLLMVGFSKYKIEDERVVQIRYSSLQWAILVNYAIVLVCDWTIYGLDFTYVLVYNMFTPLMFFVVRLEWIMFIDKRKPQLEDEK